MFTLQNNLVDFSQKRETLVSILSSLNQPKVSLEEYPAEPTRAYVLTHLEKRKYETFVVFYRTLTRNQVIYGCISGDYEASRKGEVEEAALDFLEEKGFMMDNLQWGKKAAVEKESILQGLPMFQKSPGEEHVFTPDVGDLSIDDSQALTQTLHTASEPVSSETIMRLDDLLTEDPVVEAEPVTGDLLSSPPPSAPLEPFDFAEIDFQRPDDSQALELDAILDQSGALKVVEESKIEPVQTRTAKGKLRALIRLMASF